MGDVLIKIAIFLWKKALDERLSDGFDVRLNTLICTACELFRTLAAIMAP
jgi:hypothetical protein